MRSVAAAMNMLPYNGSTGNQNHRIDREVRVLRRQPASAANDNVRDRITHRDEGVPEDVEQNLGGHDPHVVAFKLALPARNVPQVCTNVPAVLGHPQGCVGSQHIGLLQQEEGRAEMAPLRCSWRPDDAHAAM